MSLDDFKHIIITVLIFMSLSFGFFFYQRCSINIPAKAMADESDPCYKKCDKRNKSAIIDKRGKCFCGTAYEYLKRYYGPYYAKNRKFRP